MLLVSFSSPIGIRITTLVPNSFESNLECFNIFILLLSVSTSPPRKQAAASSSAPVIEAPDFFDALQLNLRISLLLNPDLLLPPRATSFEIALTTATESALELLSPTAGGMLESTKSEMALPRSSLKPREFIASIAQVLKRLLASSTSLSMKIIFRSPPFFQDGSESIEINSAFTLQGIPTPTAPPKPVASELTTEMAA